MYMSIVTRNEESIYSCLNEDYTALVQETYKILRPGDLVDTYEAGYDGAYFFPTEELDNWVVNSKGRLEEIECEDPNS